MNNIHISGTPGSGKTSMCLLFSKNILLDEGRVFWISSDINSERFAQIMENVPIRKASNFHSLLFSTEVSIIDGFIDSLQQLTRMICHLPSTRLVVIDGWDIGMDESTKKNRIDEISKLAKLSRKHEFELYVTSQSYENAGNGSEKHIIRSRRKFENLGFESWQIVPDEEKIGIRRLIKNEEEVRFKMIQEGIEYLSI